MPRAQAEQKARKPAAGLSSSANHAHPPATSAAPQVRSHHRLFILFLANHPPQLRAPLPCSFPTPNLPLHLSYPSYFLHLPSFPLSQKKLTAIFKHLPELLFCHGVSIVCGRIWARPGAMGPTRPTTGDSLSCSSLLWLLPVWPLTWLLCTRHILRKQRSELHWSYSSFSALARQPLFCRGLGGIHKSEHFSSHPFWCHTQHWARKHHPVCFSGSRTLQKQVCFSLV